MMAKSNKRQSTHWNYFFYHLLLFAGVHLAFVPIFGVLPLSELSSESYMEYIAEHFASHGVNVYQNETVNGISGIWKTVLIIHLIIEIIESLFPAKKTSSRANQSKQVVQANKPSPAPQPVPEQTTGRKAASSTRAWIYLIIAGLLEIIWASALKIDMLGGPIIIVLILSFDLLIRSVKHLGIGTSYAVFTGIGVVGMVMVDVFFFEETLSFFKILLVLLLVLFIIGLKVSESQEDAA